MPPDNTIVVIFVIIAAVIIVLASMPIPLEFHEHLPSLLIVECSPIQSSTVSAILDTFVPTLTPLLIVNIHPTCLYCMHSEK